MNRDKISAEEIVAEVLGVVLAFCRIGSSEETLKKEINKSPSIPVITCIDNSTVHSRLTTFWRQTRSEGQTAHHQVQAALSCWRCRALRRPRPPLRYPQPAPPLPSAPAHPWCRSRFRVSASLRSRVPWLSQHASIIICIQNKFCIRDSWWTPSLTWEAERGWERRERRRWRWGVEVGVAAAEEAAEKQSRGRRWLPFGFAVSLRASNRCCMSSRSFPSALIITRSVSLRGALHYTSITNTVSILK